MAKNLILVRGIPGSGKSTFARATVETCQYNNKYALHLEADMYHVVDGVYTWIPENVKAAHDWCFNTARIFLEQDYVVIVSNTFTRVNEMQRYIDHAEKYNIDYDVFRCTGEYDNVHDVPEETIQRMKERFQDYEGEIIL